MLRILVATSILLVIAGCNSRVELSEETSENLGTSESTKPSQSTDPVKEDVAGEMPTTKPDSSQAPEETPVEEAKTARVEDAETKPIEAKPANSAPPQEAKPFQPWTHQLTGKPDDEDRPYAYDIAISPDGRQVALACIRRAETADGFIRVLDANTGEMVNDLWGHSYGVASVGFSADGTRVYSGSWDVTFREFDIKTASEIRKTRAHSWPVLTLDVSEDGHRAVSGSDGLRVWNLEKGEVTREFEKLHRNNPVWSVKILPNGKRAVGGSGNGQLAIWNLDSDDDPEILASDLGRLKSVDVSSDGEYVVAAAADRPEITIIEIATAKQVRQWKAHENGVSKAIFSPDGKTILSAGGELKPRGRDFDPEATDRSIRHWDAQTGEQLKHIGDHELYVTSLAYSKDGTKFYSTSGDSTVRAWSLSPSP